MPRDDYWKQFREFPPPDVDFRTLEKAVESALKDGGTIYADPTTVSHLAQMLESYRDIYRIELEEERLREKYTSLQNAWDNYQQVRKLILGKEKRQYGK